MKVFLASVALLAVLGGILFFTWVGKNDQEVVMSESVMAQSRVCEANFDKTYKVITQTAQVPTEFMEQSKQAFKEIYQPLIEGRYQDKEGTQQQVMMKWVQESNPKFDMASAATLYAKIQTVIEVQRNEFFNEQRKVN